MLCHALLACTVLHYTMPKPLQGQPGVHHTMANAVEAKLLGKLLQGAETKKAQVQLPSQALQL